MSFSVSDGAGDFEYSSGSALGLFAKPGHLVSPRFHRMLTDLIGPNAGEVKVAWHLSRELDQGRRLLEVRVSEVSGPPEFGTAFDLSEAANTPALNFRLAQLWGGLLQRRSRHLILKSG